MIDNTQNANSIHRLFIQYSFAWIQSMIIKTHLIIQDIQRITIAIDAIISHISGIHNKMNHKRTAKIEIINKVVLWLYSGVLRVTNNPMIHEISISILDSIMIILSDRFGWKNNSNQNSMKIIPFIRKNDFIFNIFNYI